MQARQMSPKLTKLLAYEVLDYFDRLAKKNKISKQLNDQINNFPKEALVGKVMDDEYYGNLFSKFLIFCKGTYPKNLESSLHTYFNELLAKVNQSHKLGYSTNFYDNSELKYQLILTALVARNALGYLKYYQINEIQLIAEFTKATEQYHTEIKGTVIPTPKRAPQIISKTQSALKTPTQRMFQASDSPATPPSSSKGNLDTSGLAEKNVLKFQPIAKSASALSTHSVNAIVQSFTVKSGATSSLFVKKATSFLVDAGGFLGEVAQDFFKMNH